MAVKKSKYVFEGDVVEKIGEVSDEKYNPLPDNKDLIYIGKKVNRYDGYQKVSGRAKYTYDIKLPNMVYAKFIRSPFPNAVIKNIDFKKAKEIKGVIDVLTFDNTKEIQWFSDLSKLLENHVRYEGDEVACVVAETERILENAISKVNVEYSELGFSVDAEESLRENAFQIYETGNILNGKPDEYERGNIDEGFSKSEFIIKEKYSTQVVIHNPTEVHCSVVDWENENLLIYDSTQGVFEVRKRVAEALGMPVENVRVIKKYMGGGFGSKLEAGKYTVIAALISKKISRPVRIALDRKEMNLAVGNRPDSVQELKIGVKRDGTILALSHTAKASVGAYPSGGGCSWPLRTIYQCPNVKAVDYSIITNTGPIRPFRAPGHVQGIFALESIIDDAAEKIGMDPLEFRISNYAEKDQVWGVEYTSKLLREAYKKGASAIGWHRRNKNPGAQEGHIKTGIGMASQIWWGGGGPPAHANLEITKEGKITVYSGTQDLGTGTYTIIAQIAAEIMEVDIADIKVVIGDTMTTPLGPSSGGSTTAPSIAPAVRDAAEKMKNKLISTAAIILDTKEDDLVYSKGKISNKLKDNFLSINNILSEISEDKLITKGSREENLKGYTTQSFGAQFAEVEVDTLTGYIKVKRIVAAHDIGRTLNRKTLENQFHGGIIQGIGFALMEERLVDYDYGKVLNTNLHDYKMPTMMDIPDIEVIIVSKNDKKANNMGVKGIGEPAIIPTAGAIANAVYNALGVRITSLPMTPDKVLNALYA